MEKPPQDNQPKAPMPAWIKWMIIFGTVWLILAITYAIMAAQSNSRLAALIDDGVAQVKTMSETAGLPLLEQDIKSLHQMLKRIEERPEVLYASVIDHKNKILAYTDAGRLLPDRGDQIEQFQGVDTWQDQDAMVFSKSIYFAQTPIGEIRLALSLEPVLLPKKRFAIIAAIALTGLALLLLWVYGREWTGRIRDLILGRRAGVDVRFLLCPLCGQKAHRDARFCHASNMENAPIIRFFGNGADAESGSALHLSEIGSNPSLAPVKDQMIRQCAEIIKRLAAEEPPALRQARRT